MSTGSNNVTLNQLTKSQDQQDQRFNRQLHIAAPSQHLTNAASVSKSGNTLKILGGATINEALQVNGQMSGYHRLATGDIRGMTVEEKTDTEADAGLTLTAGTLTNSRWDAGAACAITVPALEAGDVCAVRFAASQTGGANIVFTLNSAQTFNAESLPLRAALPTSGASGSYIAPEPTVGFGAGTGTLAITAAHKIITISGTTTNNQTGIGAYVLLCGTGNNKVSFGFKPVTSGTGVLNATFTAT